CAPCRSRRGGLDTDPVRQVTDVDAGGAGMRDGQGGEPGTLLGLAAVPRGDPGGATEVGGGRLRQGVRAGGGVGGLGLAGGPGGLPKENGSGPGRGRSGGESAPAPAVPTGSAAGQGNGSSGGHQTSGPKTLPDPIEPAGGAHRLRAPE